MPCWPPAGRRPEDRAVPMPQKGEKAPHFTLPSTHGEMALSRLLSQGRVVLAFYTEDNTPT